MLLTSVLPEQCAFAEINVTPVPVMQMEEKNRKVILLTDLCSVNQAHLP
jgi:hypothetical protein